jgi:hypothetical protein
MFEMRRGAQMNVWTNTKPNSRLVAEFATLEPDEALATALSALACMAVAAEIPEESVIEHVRYALKVAAGGSKGAQ